MNGNGIILKQWNGRRSDKPEVLAMTVKPN